MKTRKLRKGGMHDFNERIISNYSPISSRGGRTRKRKPKPKTKPKRRTVRR